MILYCFYYFFNFILNDSYLSKGFVSFNETINYQFDFKYLKLATNPILYLFVLGVLYGLTLTKVRVNVLAINAFFLFSIIIFLFYYFNTLPFTISLLSELF